MNVCHEINFDGIVGPTHNYSGLSYGNIASIANEKIASNPRQAAFQGLEKMKALHDLGIKQAVLPPHLRPYISGFSNLGFSGTDAEILNRVSKETPELMVSYGSAAAMWAANAATITPSVDSVDRRIHITPANLSSKLHRSIEHLTTSRILQRIFATPEEFIHHPVLPEGTFFSDEGAANHTRFCRSHGEPGVHLFVFGRYSLIPNTVLPTKYPARQTFEATQSIVRRHLLYPDRVIFAQQNPRAIDAGVFHNDVVSIGNENVFLYHEEAFIETSSIIQKIQEKVAANCKMDMIFIKVPEMRIPLEEAVKTYLFNSQIVTRSNGTMALIAPFECSESPAVHEFIQEVIADSDNPIHEVHYFNLRESMRNGGGPACLRLRVVLTEHEVRGCHQGVFLTESLYMQLREWVRKHYRDRLTPEDLADPQLALEVREALEALQTILRFEYL